MRTPPGKIGLYDPRHEHDSCGVSFVANLHGVRSNELVRTGLTALTNLEHRGATGAEADTGDGAGILLQVPDALYRAVVEFDLPAAGHYATGIGFLPTDDVAFDKAIAVIESTMADSGLEVVGWRELPTDPTCLGATALAAMPRFMQLFVSDPAGHERHRPRSQGVRGPQAPAPRADGRTRHLLRVAVLPHGRLQGDAHHPAS